MVLWLMKAFLWSIRLASVLARKQLLIAVKALFAIYRSKIMEREMETMKFEHPNIELLAWKNKKKS